MNIAIVRPKHWHPPSVQIAVAPAAFGQEEIRCSFSRWRGSFRGNSFPADSG